MIKESRELAKRFHSGQFRRDGKTPYFYHVEDVFHRLINKCQKDLSSFNLNILGSVAYLHDILEDTDCTEDDIWYELLKNKENSPNNIRLVIQHVNALTKQDEQDYEDYILTLYEDEKIVKIADILSNLSDSPTKNQVKKYSKALTLLLGY